MKHWVTYPLTSHPYDPRLVTKDAVVRFARAAEEAGFAGIGFTDHPAPSDRWLKTGGHDALDPFAALAFVAAVTDRLRLIPNILVLPYRNPFLVAKAIATIDALSGGRFTLAAATGYQRSEYGALGVEYGDRNQLFDEALVVLRGIWASDDFAYDGISFTARGQTANPKPTHVPIWIGGNSRLARRRVAAGADGWNPFPAPAAMASVVKTPRLETLADLASMIEDLWRHVEQADRDPETVDISFVNLAGGSPGTPDFHPDEYVTGLEELSNLGVTWVSTGVPGDSIDHAVESLEQYGDEVITPTAGDG